jgi:hypothetical protein
MGKPRAKVAIAELLSAGLLEITESSTRLHPQYRLRAPDRSREPIFLPVELVTGLSTETPLLRRMRETGDDLLLRMLIDLYGLVEVDAPFAIPLQFLRSAASNPPEPTKVFETGVHAVWSFAAPDTTHAAGEWTSPYRTKSTKSQDAWAPFWERLRMLQRLGALWFEPWVFSSAANDAEPLFPANIDDVYSGVNSTGAEVARSALSASAHLAAERPYLLDSVSGTVLIPLPTHHQTPALRGVARLRVEADTPGRRLAYARRMSSVEAAVLAYDRLSEEALRGEFSRPLRLLPRS